MKILVISSPSNCFLVFLYIFTHFYIGILVISLFISVFLLPTTLLATLSLPCILPGLLINGFFLLLSSLFLSLSKIRHYLYCFCFYTAVSHIFYRVSICCHFSLLFTWFLTDLCSQCEKEEDILSNDLILLTCII